MGVKVLIEQQNVQRERPNEPPDEMGRTLIAKLAEGQTASGVLTRIVTAWARVASWGRWCDEALGDWPETETCISQLPDWLAACLRAEAAFEVENWLSDVHERDWIWWSGSALSATHLKIDLSTNSLPMSSWPIEYVIERAGATIVYRDRWVSVKDANDVIDGGTITPTL